MLNRSEIPVEQILYSLRHSFYAKRGCKIAAFNTYAFSAHFEADFAAVNPNGYAHEVEIKRSRADFLNDFKKESNQQQRLRYEQQPTYSIRGVEYPARKPPPSELKHDQLQQGLLANYFWFCVPEGMVTLAEVPEYCGLFTFTRKRGSYAVVKCARKAKRLHPNPITPKQMNKLMVCMMFKAWKGLERTMIENYKETR